MKLHTIFSVCLSLSALAYQSTAYPASEGEEQALSAAVDRFYSALNTLFSGDAGPMIEVWSHADDVTYMGPTGGLYVGWDAVLGDWQAQADLKLGGQVLPSDMVMVIGRDLAVTSNNELGINTNADGEVQRVSIRATNMFRKEDGHWKMIGHHTDLLPYLQ